jgi:hypothetical protein
MGFFGIRGPLKLSFQSSFKLAHSCQKKPKLHTNSLNNSYLCNQLGNALFCVTSGIFAGRAQRDPAKSHELHKIAFPDVLHTRFFLILTKEMFLQTLNEVMKINYYCVKISSR